MSDAIITVSNLGKKYRIRHNAERRRHVTLREVLTDKARRLFSRSRAVAAGVSSPAIVRATQEDFWALKEVSFEVKRGEVIGIIGRNGAGKSTLLKVLSRITEPTEGRVHLKGRVASLLEVGTGFHQELTGRENIFLNGAILGMSRAEIRKKFDEIVAFAEVEKFLDTPVKRYSSGMYVRLAFAVAAHLEPEILIVDEVLAVGDAAFQKKCLGKMQDVAGKEGRTVLFVSHNMATMRRLCQSGVLMEHGRIACLGSMESAIDRYMSSAIGVGSSGPLEASAHAVNTGEFVIRQVSLLNPAGAATANFLTSEPITIQMDITVRTRVQGLRVGLGINSLDRSRISTVHHTDDGLPPFEGHPGNYQLSFQFDNNLLPGSYLISAGAHQIFGGQTVDYVPEAVRFQVVPAALEDENHSYTSGFVRLRGSWSPPRLLNL